MKEASRTAGFGNEQQEQVFVKAAEDAFRPEFLNRIDRILPFHPLSRDDIARIARLLMDDVVEREGLRRRRCVLHVEERVMDQVVDQGFHPQWGARALRRAIEERLTAPVAERLAAFSPELPSVITVSHDRHGNRVDVQELREAEPVENPVKDWAPAELLERCRQLMTRVAQQFDADRPQGSVSVESLTDRHLRYFAVDDQIERVRQVAERLQHRIELDRDRIDPPSLSPRQATARPAFARISNGPTRRMLKELAAAEDIVTYLRDVLISAQAYGSDMDQLHCEAAVLAAMADEGAGPGSSPAIRQGRDSGRPNPVHANGPINWRSCLLASTGSAANSSPGGQPVVSR